MTLIVWNHNKRLQADHFLDPQIYTKGFANNKPIFDRKSTFIEVFNSFLLGIRIIMCMLAGSRNRRSGLTYCNVADACCVYELTSSTQLICILFYVYNELKWLLRLFIP